MKFTKFIAIASMALISFVACEKDQKEELPEVTISGTTVENVMVMLSKTSEEAVSVVLESDNAKIKVTSPVTIEAGKTTANVVVTPDEDLTPDTYEPVISIKSATGAVLGATVSTKLSYEVEAPVSTIAGEALNTTKTLDLSNKEMPCYFFFENPININGAVTFVYNVYMDETYSAQNTLRFGDGADDPAHAYMHRYGQPSAGETCDTTLEVMICEAGDNGQNRVKLYYDNISVGTWVTYALTVDGTTVKLYTDGNLSTESLCNNAPEFGFQSIEFGNSWGASWRKEFKGNVCGVSVWTRALTDSEIAELTGKAPKLDAEGLAAYWAFDEGAGYVIKEKTGKYENIDFSKAARNDNDNATELKDFDASSYVQWD